jgi:hypothetical protein
MAGETVARATGDPRKLADSAVRSVDPHEEKEQARTAQSFVVPPPPCSQSGSHRSSPR